MEVYSEAQLQLEQFTMDALERHQHEMAALWFKYGDCCNKQFFTFHKPREKRVNIQSLQLGTQVITEQSAKQKVITDFYRALYKEEACTAEVHEARDRVWSQTPKVITPRQNDQLSLPIDTWELHEAVKSLAKNKSPGWDGVPSEFFQVCYYQIQSQLLRAVQEVMITGTLREDLNRGVITLISKGGDLHK